MKEDFQVFDNGKRQDIRQFSEETCGILAAAATPLPQGAFTNQIEQRSGAPPAVTAILLCAMRPRARWAAVPRHSTKSHSHVALWSGG